MHYDLSTAIGRIKADNIIEAIAFFVDLKQWPNHRCKTIHMVYRLDVNEFRGKRSVQLIVEHLEAQESE